jgi:hypothetical protein
MQSAQGRPRAAAIVAALLLAVPAAARAGDCAGMSVRRLTVARDSIRLRGTITAPGLTRSTVVAPGAPLEISIVDADDPTTVLFSASIPGDAFVTGPRAVRYSGGAGGGRVVLKNWKPQDSTVWFAASLPADVAAAAGGPARNLRLYLRSGDLCGRSCASACQPGAAGLVCARSAIYVPPRDTGYGALVPAHRRLPKSFLCGLEIRTDGEGCDFLIEESCLLPYPSSYFLAPDTSTPTGLRINYGPTALPANVSGTHIDPTDWNTLDGFSPGPKILALFPDTGAPVDLDASGAAFHTDFAGSLDPENATILLDAATGERIVHFAEMDANTNDVRKKALIVRPGRRLADGTRYIVALRNLVDANGTPIAPRLAFRALRDGLGESEVAAACGAACAAAVEARRATYADIMSRLEAAGVEREELVLAWDFTTASTQALTAWIVAVRDQAFALGTPAFSVTSIDDRGGAGFDTHIWARIQGTFQAPLFMTADAPASRLNLVGGVPRQNGFATVPFVVDVPRSAVPAPGCASDCTVRPARATLWGHGLLGDRFQLRALSALANMYNYVIAAVDMQGMSSADVFPSILPITQNVSLFHRIPERLHQGFLHHLLLGRLLVDPVGGFNTHAAFQFGSPPAGVIDTSDVYYSGGSQGGIFGIAIMSIAEDFRRGFLAVPGANYSTLLRRSIDFNPFLQGFRASYPDALDETLTLALLQQLWDRAEPQGYMNHLVGGDLSDPPVPHKVLIHMATHDSEVSNLATQIMVRSLGIPQLRPVHRSFFQILEADAPFDGSAFVEIDPRLSGSRCHTPTPFVTDAGAPCLTDADCPGVGDPPSRTMCASGIPPLTNQAPLFNNRAHGSTGTPAAGMQIAAFLRPDGTIVQFCDDTCDPE